MKTFIIQDRPVYIDDQDEHLIKAYAWYLNANGYVVATVYEPVQATILLHRMILNVKEGQILDHIDGNKLNNTRNNLRLTNRRINKLNSFACKGVRLTTSGKFQARVGQQNLGSFNTYEEAYQARQTYIQKEVKEFYSKL